MLRPAIALSSGRPTGSPVDGSLVVEAEVAAVSLGAAGVQPRSRTSPRRCISAMDQRFSSTASIPAPGAPLQIRTARAGVTLTGRRELAPLLELRRRHRRWRNPLTPRWTSRRRDRRRSSGRAGRHHRRPPGRADIGAAGASARRPRRVSCALRRADERPVAAAGVDSRASSPPGQQFAAYHARVLAEPDALARTRRRALATLLRSTTATAATPIGEGNAEAPWRTVLFSDVVGQVSLDAWTSDYGGSRRLHLAAGLTPAPSSIGAKRLKVCCCTAS